MTDKDPLDLAELDAGLRPVKLPASAGGAVVTPLPLDAVGYKLSLQLRLQRENANPELLWDIARRALPAEVTDEQLRTLSARACLAIISIAAGKADAAMDILNKRPPQPSPGTSISEDRATISGVSAPGSPPAPDGA